MKVFEANSKWLLIAIFHAMISNSLNCTFRSVTDNFNASLKGIYNVTTEQECLSKCSADPECTFLTYYEGRCEVFEDGNDVQDLTSVSKAYSYSFEEQETSCPTTVVSRPQTSTKLCATPDALPCSKYRENIDGDIVLTKRNLFEMPDDLLGCSLVYVVDNKDCGCTLKKLDLIPVGDKFRFSISDKDPSPDNAIVCGDYNVKAPYAVAEYVCKETGRYVYVVDTESGANPDFCNFGGLERVESSPIFYVTDTRCFDE